MVADALSANKVWRDAMYRALDNYRHPKTFAEFKDWVTQDPTLLETFNMV